MGFNLPGRVVDSDHDLVLDCERGTQRLSKQASILLLCEYVIPSYIPRYTLIPKIHLAPGQ